jgi:hypothetical protein
MKFHWVLCPIIPPFIIFCHIMYNTPVIGKFNSCFKCISTYFTNTHIKSTNLLECTLKVQELYTHTKLTVFMYLTWPRVHTLAMYNNRTTLYWIFIWALCRIYFNDIYRQYHKNTSSQKLNKIETATLQVQHTNYLQSTKKTTQYKIPNQERSEI